MELTAVAGAKYVYAVFWVCATQVLRRIILIRIVDFFFFYWLCMTKFNLVLYLRHNL